MNQVSEILLASVRGALNGKAVESGLLANLEPSQWLELVKLAQQHNVMPLVCDGLAGLRKELPAKVFARVAGLTVVAEDKYEARVNVIKTIASLMAENKIPLMVIKGYGVSLYYPQPNHRSFSDIDTYHFGQLEAADKVLKERLGVDIDVDVHHHTTCVYKGVLIENHYDFINVTQHRSCARYEKILKAEAAKETRLHRIDDQEIMLPSAMFNALFLMRHMALHYAAERVSVRHLCDWKQFVEAEGENVDWERVNKVYAEYNMKRFADAITALCIDYLGMKRDVVPGVGRDAKLENRILNDILYAEFSEEKPEGFLRIVWWKTRRFFANRWKHKLVYNESWLWTFFQSSWAHLIKPKTITH